MTNVIFGFVSAVGGPVLPSIIIEFLGPDNLAMGYGFLLIFEGVGSFAGPPLAGNLVREKISYDLITLFLVNSMMHASRIPDNPLVGKRKLCIYSLLVFLGLLYNLTESYDCAFYLAASLFLMGGAVMALPVLKFHKAPGPPIHATRSTSTIETQTFDDDKFLTD